jgi:hypothetical protein
MYRVLEKMQEWEKNTIFQLKEHAQFTILQKYLIK